MYTQIPEQNITSPSGVLNTIRTTDQYPIFIIRYNSHFPKPKTIDTLENIDQGLFPKELKLTKVIPTSKSDDKQFIQNCRPISAISYFEKVIYNHVIDFQEHNIAPLNKPRYYYIGGTGSKCLRSMNDCVRCFLKPVNHSILFKDIYAYGWLY